MSLSHAPQFASLIRDVALDFGGGGCVAYIGYKAYVDYAACTPAVGEVCELGDKWGAGLLTLLSWLFWLCLLVVVVTAIWSAFFLNKARLTLTRHYPRGGSRWTRRDGHVRVRLGGTLLFVVVPSVASCSRTPPPLLRICRPGAHGRTVASLLAAGATFSKE